MTDKVKFIAHLRCYDALGKTCYFSKRTICNPSVVDIFDDFLMSTLPIIVRRLPDDTRLSMAELSLYSIDTKLKFCDSHLPNYYFKVNL